MAVEVRKGMGVLALGLALLAPSIAAGQFGEEEPEIAVGASVDLVTSYIWRGLELSDEPNIQPSVWVAYGPLEVGTWGSHSIEADFHEQDFWVTYYLPENSAGSFALTLNDYYINSDFGEDFFDFSGTEECDPEEGVGDPPMCATGPHTLELAATFSPAAVPVDLLVAYNFHNDPQSAVYAEAFYGPSIGEYELGFTAGGVLGESQWYYGTDGAALTNLGASVARSMAAGRFSIPVGAQVIYNPDQEETYFVFAVGVAAEL